MTRSRAFLGLALAAACVAAGGCRPPPLWPLKNDIGGRCPYFKDLPRYEIVYSYGDGPSRTTLRLGWLGALVERAGPRGLGLGLTRARCLDHDTLAEVFARTSAVLPRIEDTFAPHGAAILDAGWSETIEFTNESKTRSTAWLSQGPGRESDIPPALRDLLHYYAFYVRTLSSGPGSPPLDATARRDLPPAEPGTAAEVEVDPPPAPPPPTPGP